ncbi:MAG: 2-hydroxyacyl-CoA dehydratase [Ammonifex sp.]|jgi:benzoyl-CoA reductase/2-hydroxyglutaryl-CoA dehydratase subunit BcrC/BadD/HgdB|nr:MAG: 2-hydroxyacyl-CoA dehydratase [Ammonifex sp.]
MKVGLTTTIPVEVLFAAGVVPVDLNNLFIASETAGELLEVAERAGYPRNVCGWIKGIYGAVLRDQEIRTVVAVTQGDCSNTHALMETLELEGIRIIPFAYPYDRERRLLETQIECLMEHFGVDQAAVNAAKDRLDAVRQRVREIDYLTYAGDRVTGFENHFYQVCCSDFQGDVQEYRRKVDSFLAEAEKRPSRPATVRLGYIGVPPIFTDLYGYFEERGARVVFNEVQRQFAMPFEKVDLVEQYLLYTYPYGIFYRLEDITRELKRRKIAGVIHYAQSFCFRQIEDMIIRRILDVPVLTIEGDRPEPLDARTRVRIDAFLEMLE